MHERYPTASSHDLLRIIERLAKRVSAIESGRGASITSVDAGQVNFLNGTAQIWDAAGNVVVSANSLGEGINKPYLQLRHMSEAEFVTPPIVTTSTSFARLYRIHGVKLHPQICVRLVLQVDSGSTGEVQITDASTPANTILSTVKSFSNSVSGYDSLIFTVPGSLLADLILGVEVRRSAGAGSVRVGIAYVDGRGN